MKIIYSIECCGQNEFYEVKLPKRTIIACPVCKQVVELHQTNFKSELKLNDVNVIKLPKIKINVRKNKVKL